MKSIFFSAAKTALSSFQVRSFSAAKVKFPQSLKVELNSNFNKYFNSSLSIKDGAQKMVKFLKDEIAAGSQESAEFLTAICDFKNSPHKEMFLENTSENPTVMSKLPLTLAHLFDEKLQLLKFGNLTGTDNVGAHSDGSRLRQDMHLTVLTGKLDDGSALTCTMDIEDLFAKLSPQNQEILSSSMFRYSPERVMLSKDSDLCKAPIFYRSEDGILKVNFSYDSNNFLYCDFSKSNFSQEEVCEAVENLYLAIEEKCKNNEIGAYSLKPGTVLINKNEENLHFVKDKSGKARVVEYHVFAFPNSSVREFGVAKLGDSKSESLGKT